MSKFKCIIIEDEPIAAEIIKDYITDVPFLDLQGTFHDAIAGLDFLNKHPVDLIFLDIHLPKLKGLDFLKSLQHPPAIIITTAFEEYAFKGYEFNVLDYLLKPIEFSRFLQAVNKLKDKEAGGKNSMQDPVPTASIHLNVNKKLWRVELKDLLYVESKKEYLDVHTSSRVITCKMQINEMEKLLNPQQFIRIHRSFIVATDKVDTISLTELEINKIKLPVGRNYREQVKKRWFE